MGLTVHYTFRSSPTSSSAVREIIEALHHRATELPFDHVGPIHKFQPNRHVCQPTEEMSPLLRYSMSYIRRENDWHCVSPKRGFAFEIDPGPGCEFATIGLVEYPVTVILPSGNLARTDLSGWQWERYCKTQYASNPRFGGFENFQRCHVSLIELLDLAKELGLQMEVDDESNYAEHRDLNRLRDEVLSWNRDIAGFVGALKDETGDAADAPIAAFPDFEHLEAKSRAASPRTRLKRK